MALFTPPGDKPSARGDSSPPDRNVLGLERLPFDQEPWCRSIAVNRLFSDSASVGWEKMPSRSAV
jgi:hypothetical protein